MRQGLYTRGIWDPHPPLPEFIRLRNLKLASFGIWDPEQEQRDDWFRVKQKREWDEWISSPDFKFFPDSPFF